MYTTGRYSHTQLDTLASKIPLLDRSDSPRFTDLTVEFQKYQAAMNDSKSHLDMGGQSKAWETLMTSVGEIYKGAGNDFFKLNEHIIANKNRMSPRVISRYLERQFAYWGITKEATPAPTVLTSPRFEETGASEASLEDVAVIVLPIEESVEVEFTDIAGLSEEESESGDVPAQAVAYRVNLLMAAPLASTDLEESSKKPKDSVSEYVDFINGLGTPPILVLDIDNNNEAFDFQLPASRYPSETSGSESFTHAMNRAALADRLYDVLSLPIQVLEAQAPRPESTISELSETEASLPGINQFVALEEPEARIVSPLVRSSSDESTDTSNVDQETNSPASSVEALNPQSERPLSSLALSEEEATARRIRGLRPQEVIARARLDQNKLVPAPLLRARELPLEALAPLDRVAARAIEATEPRRHRLLKPLHG